MSPEQKVAMLKEAGVWDVIGFPSCIDKLFDLVAAHEREVYAGQVEVLIQKQFDECEAAVLAEREACAKVCEQDEFQIYETAERCAAAIRARSDNASS